VSNTYQLEQEGQDKGVFLGDFWEDGEGGVADQSSGDAI
jgi:hypothetical protein